MREWTQTQLSRTSAAIDEELWRRDQERQESERAELERKRQEEAEVRAATVTRTRYIEQSVRCGKEACRCMRGGSPHPGYWYRIETFGDGRRRKVYVGKTRPKGAT